MRIIWAKTLFVLFEPKPLETYSKLNILVQ